MQQKHWVSKAAAHNFVNAQWSQLESHFGSVPKEEARDLRRPAEPELPPSRKLVRLHPAVKREKSEEKTSERKSPSPVPGKRKEEMPSGSGSGTDPARDQGHQLLRDLFRDLADRVLK